MLMNLGVRGTGSWDEPGERDLSIPVSELVSAADPKALSELCKLAKAIGT